MKVSFFLDYYNDCCVKTFFRKTEWYLDRHLTIKKNTKILKFSGVKTFEVSTNCSRIQK